MIVVMLAAGTSSRMGKENKMLLPYEGSKMACHCCINALSFLETLDEPSQLIVVTGYKSRSLVKSLEPCLKFIERTSSPVTLKIVENRDYRKGQTSSAKAGVKEIPDNNDFFICLADMPLINKAHYKSLIPLLKDNDAVKPFCDGKPGHPVLLSSKLKDKIIRLSDSSSIKNLLEKHKVAVFQSNDKAFITDCDTPSEFKSLVG